jgi:crotonobetainyl-CoA:carnitine CoA-transferase CaiB-like acyl-CoA transferase
MDDALPYRDLRVVDMSQGVAGPFCGMMLALYGADVVKVEPTAGDWIRQLGRRYGEHTAAGLANNRGKRSVALDLRSEAGQAVVRRLAASADVYIESFRPGVSQAMGLGYAALSALNPDLLYVSVSGFGQTGPYAERPCVDSVAQSFTGLLSINRGADGVPHRVPFLIVDQVTGMAALQAVQAALYGRRAGAPGRHIDVSLMQSAATVQTIKLVEAALENGAPEALAVPNGSYQAKDGWINLSVIKHPQWQALARLIGRPDLADDPDYATTSGRAARADTLVPLVAAAIAGREADWWIDVLSAENILCQRVMSHAEFLADPHVRATGAAPAVPQAGVGPVPAVHVPGTPTVDPADPRQQVPGIGADGRAILADWGFATDEIDRLAKDGILREKAA